MAIPDQWGRILAVHLYHIFKMNNTLNCTVDLKGTYNVKIIRNNEIAYNSDWCNNTILSGGLMALYNTDVPDFINYLDLGVSGSLGGSAGYYLNGILAAPPLSSFINILCDNKESYIEGLSSKVYKATFSTISASQDISLQEFAIKPALSSNAFARNTFGSAIDVLMGDILEFTYKIKLNWYNTTASTAKINTGDGYTYSIPLTTYTYNIPVYDRPYYNKNYLVLTTNNDPITAIGAPWPVQLKVGISTPSKSSFPPTEIGYSINHSTKSVTVSTVYTGVQSNVTGIYRDISTFLIIPDNSLELDHRFTATRFAVPFVFYNISNLYYNLTGISNDTTSPFAGTFLRNRYNFNYNYTWREA